MADKVDSEWFKNCKRLTLLSLSIYLLQHPCRMAGHGLILFSSFLARVFPATNRLNDAEKMSIKVWQKLPCVVAPRGTVPCLPSTLSSGYMLLTPVCIAIIHVHPRSHIMTVVWSLGIHMGNSNFSVRAVKPRSTYTTQYNLLCLHPWVETF